MTDFIIEIMLYILAYLALMLAYWAFTYPGAIVRWLLLGKKRNLKDLLEDGRDYNALYIIIPVALFLIICVFIRDM